MPDRVLITGGAGFIGSHLADELLASGYRVRVLDNLTEQVHPGGQRPEYLAPEVELLEGDVRDADTVRKALKGVDSVVHLAAAVGVGQSMYEIVRYTSLNNLGTAVLLEELTQRREQIRRVVVASSMSIYGEGLYKDPEGHVSASVARRQEQLQAHEWEVRNNRQEVLTPIPTPETKRPTLASVYALGKYDQELMCLMVGRAYSIETVALRFFNVYGPRQALSNPYTGVLAIFASRLLNGKPPIVFEDGMQRRDFVSVHDVKRAIRLALERPAGPEGPVGRAINVGSGRSCTVLEVAAKVAHAMNMTHIEPEVSGQYRVGDIRHCFADIRLARRLLGYEPSVQLDTGVTELAQWLEGQVAVDGVDRMKAELSRRGLTI